MRKPLLIVFFLSVTGFLSAQTADTTRHHTTRQWALSDDFTEEVPVALDTASSLYHRNRLTDKYSWFSAYTGNYGQPLYQFNFFDRITDPDKFLYRYLYPFMHLPDNALFINTQVPFTEMVFSYAGPRDRAEQTFRVRHSQNINRFINFGLVYDIAFDLGQYMYQRANDKTFAFHFSYTGEKYKAYFQAGINNFNDLQNGGISDASQLPSLDTRDVAVNLGELNNSQLVTKNWNILLVQKYVLNKKAPVQKDTSKTAAPVKEPFFNGIFSHILTIDKTGRSYSDASPSSGFYPNIWYNSNATADTLSQRIIKNTLRFDFTTNEKRKFRLGGGFGIRNELYSYYQDANAVMPAIGLYSLQNSGTASWTRSNNLLVGRLFNNIGNKFRWGAEGELYLSGYRAGDFNAKGLISRSFDFRKGKAVWNITGSVNSTTPSEWYNTWLGNNFRWQNSFSKEFGFNAGTEFQYPARRMSLRFNYGVLNNYAYFGNGPLPAQYSGALSVAALQLRKEVSVWKLHLDNQLLFQLTSNKNVADLPLATLRSAVFLEHNFHFKLTNGDLLTQIGGEVFWNSVYNGMSWMPATGTYYQAQDTPTGSYPFINAFLNIKLKRTRIFLMLDHLNSKMSGYDYYLVPGYPMNIRYFRYGFAWTFYD
jgi:hypothetical protein